MSHAFQLIAGHPALDFVNTLDNRFAAGGPSEFLNSYADLLSFTRQAGLLDAGQVQALSEREQSTKAQSSKAAAVLRSARDLRESLADVFYAALNQPSMPVSKTLKKLENYFQRVDTHRELVWKRGSGGAPPRVAWHWGSFAGDLDLPEWALACSSEQFLTSSAMDQIRSCGSETCRWLFYDTSKNHSRRWCDMKICGNRMKARRFQQRRD